MPDPYILLTTPSAVELWSTVRLPYELAVDRDCKTDLFDQLPIWNRASELAEQSLSNRCLVSVEPAAQSRDNEVDVRNRSIEIWYRFAESVQASKSTREREVTLAVRSDQWS